MLKIQLCKNKTDEKLQLVREVKMLRDAYEICELCVEFIKQLYLVTVGFETNRLVCRS
jgi:hypothetical protein